MAQEVGKYLPNATFFENQKISIQCVSQFCDFEI